MFDVVGATVGSRGGGRSDVGAADRDDRSVSYFDQLRVELFGRRGLFWGPVGGIARCAAIAREEAGAGLGGETCHSRILCSGSAY